MKEIFGSFDDEDLSNEIKDIQDQVEKLKSGTGKREQIYELENQLCTSILTEEEARRRITTSIKIVLCIMTQKGLYVAFVAIAILSFTAFYQV